MLHTMLKKWWVILIQGILMVVLGFYCFNNPGEVLAGISLWFGMLALITGIVGLLGWIFAGKGERDFGSLIWSIFTALFGLFVLMHLFAAMKAITMVFGIWVLITGFSLISSGWALKKEHFFGWILIILAVFAVIAGFMMITNIGSGAEGVSTILGLSVLFSGIGLIILSISKKMLMGKFKDKVNTLKS
ncbi:MAG TPA: DUF308 domain-containing protein [Ignavibacteria bacterium]|nr:DUF308 domain-containing protein [Ignavibacteria bacterium]